MRLLKWFLRLLTTILGFERGVAILFSEDFIESIVLVVASKHIAMVEG
jgi:hypothetical protein